MKYLALLLLVSCASTKPNCVITESGTYLNTHLTLLECSRIPMCSDGDIECLNSTICRDDKDKNGKYMCVRRD